MNPISGTVKKAGIPGLVEKYLDKDKFSYTIQCTQYAGHATKIAEKAKDEHVDIVVAIGGDGTINEVGRALIQSDTAMGIIPCGSGNGLARHLMLPMDIKKAIKVINECEIHKLDYGLIDGHPFFCTCGMGFDAYISMKFAQAGKRGPVTYLENILKEGVKYEPEKYCVKLDAPQISIDMFNKTLDKNTKIKTFKSKHLDIQREKPGYIHYDGDPIMAPANITIHVVSKGINIIVNPFADKTKRQPNVVQNAFCEIFNDLSAVRTDISKQTRHIQSINNYLLKKLNR